MADGPVGREMSGFVAVEAGVIDVPLDGPGPAHRPADDRPPTNWRRAIGVALVVGAVLGIGVSAIRLASDEDGTTTNSVPTDEVSAGITTPPTLSPLETLPPADVDRDSTPDVAVAAGVTRREYPEVADASLTEIVQYDVGEAVELLDRDVARRSETHVELGYGGFVIDLTITRDPELDRYQLVVESRGEVTQVAIVDIPTGTTYINPGTDHRVDVPNADFIAGTTAADANEYFDRMLLGPLRSDTYKAPATRGRGLVTIDGVGHAREFLTTIAGDLIPEWQLYAFGPVFEFPVEDRPDALEYAVYVTDDGRIAQVNGVSLVGDVPQLVEHRLIELDEPDAIDMPPPTTAPPTTAPPATSPVTAATTPVTSP